MRRILHHITVSPIFGLQGKSCTEPAEIYIYIHIQIHAQIYKYAHIFIILFLKSCHASYTSNWNILEKKKMLLRVLLLLFLTLVCLSFLSHFIVCILLCVYALHYVYSLCCTMNSWWEMLLCSLFFLSSWIVMDNSEVWGQWDFNKNLTKGYGKGFLLC